MVRTRITKILTNQPYWSELGQLLSRRSLIRFSLPSNRAFSGTFEELFERDIPWIRKEWKDQVSIADTLQGFQIGLLLTVPIIWSVIIPLALLDLMATLYQKLCFPIYGIPIVERSAFVVIDRYRLPYLNGFEKLNCIYCGYGNGVLAYVREIASRTEERWCPIKHANRPNRVHTRYKGFADYGDAGGYCQKQIERNNKEERRL